MKEVLKSMRFENRDDLKAIGWLASKHIAAQGAIMAISEEEDTSEEIVGVMPYQCKDNICYIKEVLLEKGTVKMSVFLGMYSELFHAMKNSDMSKIAIAICDTDQNIKGVVDEMRKTLLAMGFDRETNDRECLSVMI